MSDLTDNGRTVIATLAARYGLSQGAVEHMARAVANGGGTMAQFNVPELGGNGQWMAGGMTMVGDMFNSGLQATVSNLCGELSNAMAQGPFFNRVQTLSGSAWWPEHLGVPSSTGGQNQARYAYFPQERRIAFDPGNGQPVILLDTRDHNIGGFSQQQSGPGDPYLGITFSSQYGQYPLSSLARVDEPAAASPEPPQQPAAFDPPPPMQMPDTSAQQEPPSFQDAPQSMPVAAPAAAPVSASGSGKVTSPDEILATIERLAKLREMGALSDEEFSAKKADLLDRL